MRNSSTPNATSGMGLASGMPKTLPLLKIEDRFAQFPPNVGREVPDGASGCRVKDGGFESHHVSDLGHVIKRDVRYASTHFVCRPARATRDQGILFGDQNAIIRYR